MKEKTVDFRIVREGGKFYIECIRKSRWTRFPLYKHETFHTPEAAERWLVTHKNYNCLIQREVVKEISIPISEFGGMESEEEKVNRIELV